MEAGKDERMSVREFGVSDHPQAAARHLIKHGFVAVEGGDAIATLYINQIIEALRLEAIEVVYGAVAVPESGWQFCVWNADRFRSVSDPALVELLR